MLRRAYCPVRFLSFVVICVPVHAWRWNKVLAQHITLEWGFCPSCEFVGVLTMYTNVTTTWCVMPNAQDKSIQLLRRQEIGIPYFKVQLELRCVKLSIAKTLHHCSNSIANWKSDSPYVFNWFPVTDRALWHCFICRCDIICDICAAANKWWNTWCQQTAEKDGNWCPLIVYILNSVFWWNAITFF